MVTGAAFGVACRMLYYLTLSLSLINVIKVEFEVARSANADAVVFCFDPAVEAKNVELNYVHQGGNIFSAAGITTISASIEGALLVDVLSNDPYFTASYTNVRLEDIQFASESPGIVLPHDASSLNCVVIHAAFLKNTRYEASFNVTNPSTGSGLPLKVWYAPLTKETSVKYVVRGSKTGAMCSASSTLSTKLGMSQPFNPADITYAANCSAALQQVFSPVFGGACVNCTCDGCVYSASTCACSSGYITATSGVVPCLPLGTGQSTAMTSDSFRPTSLSSFGSELCEFLTDWKSDILNGKRSASIVAQAYLEWLYQNAGLVMDMEDVGTSLQNFNRTYLRDGRRLDLPTRSHGIMPPGGTCTYCDASRISWFDIASVSTVSSASLNFIRDDGWSCRSAFATMGYLLQDILDFQCTSLWDVNTPYAVIGSPSTTLV